MVELIILLLSPKLLSTTRRQNFFSTDSDDDKGVGRMYLIIKMSLSVIGNEKTRRFFFHIREKCFKGWDFAPKGWLTAPNEARAVIETQGS